MPERFELSFEVTRDDWLAVNEACLRESPEWHVALLRYQREVRRQVLWTAPFMIAGASYFIGHSQATSGMYLTGAGVGAFFAAGIYVALPRVNTIEKSKQATRERISRMDFSAQTGPMTIVIDESGAQVHAANRQLKLSWQVVAPTTAGGFILLQQDSQDAIFIPLVHLHLTARQSSCSHRRKPGGAPRNARTQSGSKTTWPIGTCCAPAASTTCGACAARRVLSAARPSGSSHSSGRERPACTQSPWHA